MLEAAASHREQLSCSEIWDEVGVGRKSLHFVHKFIN